MPTDLKWTRREVVAGGVALAATGPALFPRRAPAAGGRVSGFVFEDQSGTGRRRDSDPGIPGVLVLNGRDVVQTAADGHSTLPIDGDGVVIVIKPTGFSPPVDPRTMLPRFYYVHQPEGSPDLGFRFDGLDPTGPLPAALDFPLTRTAGPSKYDVILFTDPQPESGAEVDFIRDDVVNALIGSQAAFGMTTGDLMFDDLSLYPRYNRIVGQIGLPWYKIWRQPRLAATTTSISRRPTEPMPGKHSSASLGRTILPWNTAAPCSLGPTMATTSGQIPASPGWPENTKVGSANAN